MIKNAYQFGVAMALEDLGLYKKAEEDKDTPAGALSELLRAFPTPKRTIQTEACGTRDKDDHFSFSSGDNTGVGVNDVGMDVRGPADTSI